MQYVEFIALLSNKCILINDNYFSRGGIIIVAGQHFMVFTAPPCGAPDNGASSALTTP